MVPYLDVWVWLSNCDHTHKQWDLGPCRLTKKCERVWIGLNFFLFSVLIRIFLQPFLVVPGGQMMKCRFLISFFFFWLKPCWIGLFQNSLHISPFRLWHQLPVIVAACAQQSTSAACSANGDDLMSPITAVSADFYWARVTVWRLTDSAVSGRQPSRERITINRTPGLWCAHRDREREKRTSTIADNDLVTFMRPLTRSRSRRTSGN